MNKLGISLGGVVLTGVVALASAPQALAATTVSSSASGTAATARVQQVAAVTTAQKLARLRVLTGKDAKDEWFNARVNRAHDRYRFVWRTDGCSGVTNDPLGFHFWESCARHDFGYRNYKKMHAFSSANRLRVDNSFLADMKWQCDKQWGPYTTAQRNACKRVANKYYQAVRVHGHLGG
ncbi:phospholipase [Streptomyces sp. NPDC060064]|uniref:phospholipase n=1 Tax=Streptomyces sp. NPDC060064 TaxID=3347049 RepID=UPI003684A35F